ncbi:hypothetical protein HKD37_05G011881 [Glycine soja]
MFENDLGWFQNNISRVVGDGREVSFWRTRWLGRESLLKNFNRIFLNLEQRDAKIAEVSSWNMGTMDETLVPMGTNSTAANVGLDTIGEFRPKQNKPDGWAWNLNVEKKYEVREVRETLIMEETMEDEEFFKQMWKLPISSKNPPDTCCLSVLLAQHIWKCCYLWFGDLPAGKLHQSLLATQRIDQ